MNLAGKIEAILFWKAEPIRKTELAKVLGVSLDFVNQGLETLEENLNGRGVCLVENGDEISLVTAGENSDLIRELSKKEITRDIGKAGLETLAIVLYMSPISRKEIDYIRGVNSSFILRHLLIRGFVKKVANRNDQRVFLYEPTIEILNYLGVKKIDDLPNFSEVKTKLAEFAEQLNTETQNKALKDDSSEAE